MPITEDFVGTTGAITSVEVRARVSGTLESAPFKEGTLVRQGQLIFTIQPTQYVAQVQAAQASLTKGQADLQVGVRYGADTASRRKRRAEAGDVGASEHRRLATDAAGRCEGRPTKGPRQRAHQPSGGARRPARRARATAQRRRSRSRSTSRSRSPRSCQAQSQMTDAKLNLSYTTIYAPVTGLIGFLKYDVGNVVGGSGTGTEVLDTITTVDPIKVDFAVDENTYLSLAGRTQAHHERPLLQQPVDLVLANNAIYQYPGRAVHGQPDAGLEDRQRSASRRASRTPMRRFGRVSSRGFGSSSRSARTRCSCRRPPSCRRRAPTTPTSCSPTERHRAAFADARPALRRKLRRRVRALARRTRRRPRDAEGAAGDQGSDRQRVAAGEPEAQGEFVEVGRSGA